MVLSGRISKRNLLWLLPDICLMQHNDLMIVQPGQYQWWAAFNVCRR